MDYLDPKKQRQHTIFLTVGYVLVTIAILAAVRLLLDMAYGYGINNKGQIIQNGFVFVSSQPHPAQIYINGELDKTHTNTRLTLAAGRYTLQLKRSGYRDWQRSVAVNGGDVQHFDYPLLFPNTLAATTLRAYSAAPGLATQSPDQRWLLVEQAGSPTDFDLYDLKNPSQAPLALSLPTSLLAKGSDQSWKAVEWADDNRHVLLEHVHDGASEFVVLDRQNPDQSVNLNTTFTNNPTSVSLNDKKYNQYYLFNSGQHLLQTASLKPPAVTTYLEGVLAYKSYANNTMLYATEQAASAGKVSIRMQVGAKTYPIREVAPGGYYPLELTQYSGTLYVVVGSTAENRVYIYQDPVGQVSSKPKTLPAPIRALRLAGASYASFSKNTQFIMAEAGQAVAVYDILNNRSYNFNLTKPIDSPQLHVNWIDGDRLAYVSGGNLVVLDYDSSNLQTLMPAAPGFLPFFAPDYKYEYGLESVQSQPTYNLAQTALRIPADL